MARRAETGTVRVAVVDVGTNSTRLLVAEVVGGRVRELERRTAVTRLGEGVDRTGRLSGAAVERVMGTVAEYRRAIDELGAERVVAIATSAVREAANGEELLRGLAERCGIEARVISGEEEARLTFLGATSQVPDGPEPTLVVDIGGGSTELVVGAPWVEPEFHVSTELGSVRQSERHLAGDPPAPDELEAARRDVREVLAAEAPERARARVVRGIAVAGTATSLAAIDQELDPYDPTRVQGYPLRLPACEGMLARLASLALPERRRVRGLHPDRAPTIVAGALILVEVMRAFSLEEVAASEADILHGAALQAALR